MRYSVGVLEGGKGIGYEAPIVQGFKFMADRSIALRFGDNTTVCRLHASKTACGLAAPATLRSVERGERMETLSKTDSE
jgi:hypothetical protein